MDFRRSELPPAIEPRPHLVRAIQNDSELATSWFGSSLAGDSLFGRLARALSAGRADVSTKAEHEELACLRRPVDRSGRGDALRSEESAWVPTRPMLTDL